MKLFIKLTIYKKMSRILLLLLVCSFFTRCVEPFEFETEDFESILVINTTMTNEMKHQQVLLSRSFRFEDNGPLQEQGAVVKVIEDNAAEYLFEEALPGLYLSTEEFEIVSGKEYQLSIKTLDGRSYVSDEVTLPNESSSINNVYPKRMFNNDGTEGVGILIDSFDPTGNSIYYRYEFEETYRVIAQFWAPRDVSVDLEYVPRPDGQRICFSGRRSKDIIITDTKTLSEDRVNNFLLKFIDPGDISVANRYSILVKQFVQSRDANGFYQTLINFSESESLFSQIQPGFIYGNIFSENNTKERVLGFFDVSSVSTKRMFFNREDIIEGLPRFFPSCERTTWKKKSDETIEEYKVRLQAFIRSSKMKFLSGGINILGSTLVFVSGPCGDCRSLGSNAVPSFWVD